MKTTIEFCIWVGLALFVVVILSGCAVVAGVLTAYEVTTTAVGIGQRNAQQDQADAQTAELRALRADFRKAGWITDEPLSVSEAARERELEARLEPTRPKPTFWERMRRMLP